MSTSATVKFFNSDEECVGAIYHHYDGYPSYLGDLLAKFLNEVKLVTSLPAKQTDEKLANGVECLAAQWICHTKSSAGDVYLVLINSQSEYNYEVHVNEHNLIKIKISRYSEIIFEGSLPNFEVFVFNSDD